MKRTNFPSIKKRDLAQKIRRQFGKTHAESIGIVNAILNILRKDLGAGERIEIRGFGSFNQCLHGERIAQNPKTMEQFQAPEKRVVRFKAGKELKERVNRKGEIHG